MKYRDPFFLGVAKTQSQADDFKCLANIRQPFQPSPDVLGRKRKSRVPELLQVRTACLVTNIQTTKQNQKKENMIPSYYCKALSCHFPRPPIENLRLQSLGAFRKGVRRPKYFTICPPLLSMSKKNQATLTHHTWCSIGKDFTSNRLTEIISCHCYSTCNSSLFTMKPRCH